MIYLLYVLLILAFVYNTFFGLGPVLLADGVLSERLFVLFIVLVVYIVLFIAFRRVRRMHIMKKDDENRRD